VQVKIAGGEAYEHAPPVFNIAEKASAVVIAPTATTMHHYHHPLKGQMFAVAVLSDW
jgi:hypothetical protein